MSFKPRVIVISGTPGVGKTVVALRVSEVLGGSYINLTELVIRNKLYLYYDSETSSYLIDEGSLKSKLRELILGYDGHVVVDGHYGEIVDEELVKKVIVLRLDPRVLYKRLRERGWTGRKLIDNIESELLGVCTLNALELHSPNKVCEVDTTNKNVEEVANEVLLIINDKLECRVFVDWLNRNELVSEVLEVLSRES